MSSGWPRSDKIAFTALCVTVLFGVASIIIPEIRGFFSDVGRRFLGSDSSSNRSSSQAPSSPSSDSSASLTENPFELPSENPFELPSEEEPPQESPGRLSSDTVLESAIGVDYSRLQKLLSEKESGWQEEANKETIRVIMEAAGVSQEVDFKESIIKNIDCKDLRTINTIWTTNSNERFGFSVQNSIWKKIPAHTDPKLPLQPREKFNRTVGWFDNDVPLDLDTIFFKTPERPGKLPRLAQDWTTKEHFIPLWRRLDQCNIR
jgi:hypothetical protein